MSLSKSEHTEHWNTIPKKCKNCRKAIYTMEDDKVYYQCSIYGKFKKNCDLVVGQRELPKPEKIKESK